MRLPLLPRVLAPSLPASTLLVGVTIAMAASNVEPPEMTRFRREVLADRVVQLLNIQRPALKKCAGRLSRENRSEDARAVDQALVGFPLELAESSKPGCDEKPQLLRKDPIAELAGSVSRMNAEQLGLEERVIELLSVYARAQKARTPELCQKEMDAAEKELGNEERQKMRALSGPLMLGCEYAPSRIECYKQLGRALDELDAHCYLKVRPDFGGNLDRNACFAGSGPVMKTLEEVSAGDPSVIEREQNGVLTRFFEALKKAPDGARLSWWEMFQGSALSKRSDAPQVFLALMSSIFAQAGSGIGYVDDFGDHEWRSALERGEPPRQAFQRYEAAKKRKDLMPRLLHFAEMKKVTVSLSRDFPEISDPIRHDFMAAFVSCNFQSRGETILAEGFPLLMGYGYESKDFISHLREGTGIQSMIENFGSALKSKAAFKRYFSAAKEDVMAAKQNFVEDTGRYERASRWAKKYCSSRSTR